MAEAALPGSDPGEWIETWLSEPRFAPYLIESGGDRQRALETYEWNARLAAAVMRDIAHVEVAVRNAFDKVMRERWEGTQHWLLDPTSPVLAQLWRTRRGNRVDLNARNRMNVAEAVRRCGGRSAQPDHVIAGLSLGFWRHCTDAAHEKTLWVPYLHIAWPKKTNRVTIERALTTINSVRNRASHHEPLFPPQPGRDVHAAHHEVLRLADLLIPELAEHLRRTSAVPAALKGRPGQ